MTNEKIQFMPDSQAKVDWINDAVTKIEDIIFSFPGNLSLQEAVGILEVIKITLIENSR